MKKYLSNTNGNLPFLMELRTYKQKIFFGISKVCYISYRLFEM